MDDAIRSMSDKRRPRGDEASSSKRHFTAGRHYVLSTASSIIGAPERLAGQTVANRLVKVKLDTDPPADIQNERRSFLEPLPVSVRVVTPPCLVAGRLHACFYRSWKMRGKAATGTTSSSSSRGVSHDLAHLEARLRQSRHRCEAGALDFADADRMLR
ncbi:MAG: hypothetical protein CVV51_05545 [Spirochaetae bacterium HGW-Spirochaetae-7]|nr:MAG: hypothetical protein CVV51_05545 [Spirochaetae bacterium HGW-Spirochaetae-7]